MTIYSRQCGAAQQQLEGSLFGHPRPGKIQGWPKVIKEQTANFCFNRTSQPAWSMKHRMAQSEEAPSGNYICGWTNTEGPKKMGFHARVGVSGRSF